MDVRIASIAELSQAQMLIGYLQGGLEVLVPMLAESEAAQVSASKLLETIKAYNAQSAQRLSALDKQESQ